MSAYQKSDVLSGAIALIQDHMAVITGDVVLITADTLTDVGAIEAICNAVRLAGAQYSVMTIAQLPFQGALSDPYIPSTVAAAALEATVWIDLTLPYLAGSHVFDVALKKGLVRYNLAVGLDSDGLASLYDKVDLDVLYRVQSTLDGLATEAQQKGLSCRITTPLGTDVSFRIAEPSLTKPRRATSGGIYSIPGNLFMCPDLESVKGRIVIECAYHEYYTRLQTPITVEVDGAIRSVEGGGFDRRLMDRALRRACGGDLGYVIHLTHAFNPVARFKGTNLLEDVRAAGNDAVGFGRPWWIPGGGENHPDGVMSRQSLWIGDHHIASDGAFTGDFAHFEDELQPVYG
ncbi:MAG TPA: hypothetical protein VL202_23725 [Pararhizobium sp.]|uniref:hypothetical protein n=1 Tax=Pararhizobium sp. TaxID=1977563 RepID=UPI002B516A5A|nr:hypothetical protein [Pararhizobium sp.]HTO34155.1 hypothetical protein [Pararhizobium sp.]